MWRRPVVGRWTRPQGYERALIKALDTSAANVGGVREDNRRAPDDALEAAGARTGGDGGVALRDAPGHAQPLGASSRTDDGLSATDGRESSGALWPVGGRQAIPVDRPTRTRSDRSIDMQIRSATPPDADAVWRIWNPMIRAGETYPLPLEMSRDAALAYWLRRGRRCTSRFVDDEIVGTYFLRANSERRRRARRELRLRHGVARGRARRGPRDVRSLARARGRAWLSCDAVQFRRQFEYARGAAVAVVRIRNRWTAARSVPASHGRTRRRAGDVATARESCETRRRHSQRRAMIGSTFVARRAGT